MVFRLIRTHKAAELSVSTAKATNHLVMCLAEFDPAEWATSVALRLRVSQMVFVAAFAQRTLAGLAFLDCKNQGVFTTRTKERRG